MYTVSLRVNIGNRHIL